MSSTWIASYEDAFAIGFEALGEKKIVRRLVAHEAVKGIWHGIWVGLNSRHGRIAVQPNLVAFCPAAAEFVREGLAAIYGGKPYHGPSKRLGAPVLSWPLYDLIYKAHDKDRRPSSYDVYNESGIAASITLMVRDYVKVRDKYFGSIGSLAGLEKRLQNEGMPGSGMYALATHYVMNGRVDRADVGAAVSRSSNEMTAKFAEWLGSIYAS